MLPVRPRAGWADADLPRRACAVAWVLVVVLAGVSALWALPARAGGAQWVLSQAWAFVVLLAGPPLSYSAARVLRPHVGRSTERIARHWAAAVATPYGLALLGQLGAYGGDATRLWLFADVPGAVVGVEILAASVLGPLTAAWGLCALAYRAAERWPYRLAWVRSPLLRTDDGAEDRVVDTGAPRP